MYSQSNFNEGLPPRLYRSTVEIRRDMRSVCRRIRATEEMLSVHNLLIEMIPLWASQSPSEWIPELEATVDEAAEALETIKRLKEALEALSLELEEVKCILKG